MFPVGIIQSLLFNSSNCGSVIHVLLLILPLLFSLIDKYFMIPFGIITFLWFHSWDCEIVIYMIILMLTSIFCLPDKDFNASFWNNKIFTIFRGIFLMSCINLKFYSIIFTNQNMTSFCILKFSVTGLWLLRSILLYVFVDLPSCLDISSIRRFCFYL